MISYADSTVELWGQAVSEDRGNCFFPYSDNLSGVPTAGLSIGIEAGHSELP